jgi:hypothetical protein
MSLVMALIERCPSTWHMLIERLILVKVVYSKPKLKVVYRWVLDFLAYLKVKGKSFIEKKGGYWCNETTALGGKLKS